MTEVTDTRAILAEYRWNSRPLPEALPTFISYSFENTLPTYLPSRNEYSDAFRQSFRPLTGEQRDAARAAFAQWDAASGVRFFEVPSGMGGIRLSVFNLELGSENIRDAAAVFVGRFSPTAYAPITAIFADITVGAELDIFLHEIGHALGLKHPFEGDFTLPYDDDHVGTTVMSYDYLPGQTGETLGTLDRQAIVQIYGTNAEDGAHVASWRWDATSFTLHQEGDGRGDYILGVDGHNVINGNAGDDLLIGADGHDILRGGDGADGLFGHGGNDHLYGQSATGGSDGADLIRGGDGADYLQGNAGADTLDGGSGADRILGGQGDDLIRGGDQPDTANGNIGNDTIDGEGGNDVLRGGQGNDSILGGNGNDVLSGDLGDDSILGGAGQDLLTGGAGADRFVFGIGDTGSALPDTITDFTDGTDRIALGFAVTTLAHLTALDRADAVLVGARAVEMTAGKMAVVGVGSSSYLVFAEQGTGGVNAAILLSGIATSQIDTGDFG